MRLLGLTQVDRARAAAPNLVDQYCEAERPNAIWVADITYVPTSEGRLHLAAVMDLCTRKRVGWSLKATLEAEIALEAFDRAVAMASFFHTLKVEKVNWKQYRTKREAAADLNWWIEV